MRHLLLAFFFTCSLGTLTAQSYITALGLRMGTDWGITMQQRIANRMTVEGIAQTNFSRREVVLTGILQGHLPLGVRHFNVYAGGGLHKGWYIGNEEESRFNHPFGLTIAAGAELTLGRVNLSYDFMPAINFTGGAQRVYMMSGLSIRYVLLKDKALHQAAKKRKKKRSRRTQNHKSWRFWD
jgi:hypothetical protein